jgi:hypothetical protein
MKKLIGVIILLGCSITVFSQAAFIRSGNGSTTVYRSLDSVVANYQAGDTIYLPGGTFEVGNVYFTRKVVVYGAGHYPDSAAATGRTVLNGNINITGNASQSMFQGFYLSGNIALGTDAASSNVKGLVIQRCSFGDITLAVNDNYNSLAENIMIRECVVRSNLNVRYAKDVLIENNLINGALYNTNGSVKVSNNIMFGNGHTLYIVTSVLFENNIFYQAGGFQYASGSNTFRNNVFRMASPLIGSDIGENNLFSVSSLFVHPATAFDYGINFHLAAGSPAIAAGKGGTDCGIYGGPRSYKEAAVPSNPHVRSKTISDNTNASGQLQVQVTVAAQSN